MNWYKKAITEKEFYDFYGYSSLDEESLKNNPVLLYEMIEHLNYIREYYLNYLVNSIASELFHTMMKVYRREDSEEELSLEERRELAEKRNNTRENMIHDRYNSQDFAMAIQIFEDYKWRGAYGGKAWADIAKWTKKLYEIGEISQEKFNSGLFNKIQRLIMILDTIHSLEHNTNNVLVELPQEESEWMQLALEIVKNVKKNFNLLPLLQNKNLKEQIQKNRMVNEQKYDSEINNAYRDYFETVFEHYKKGEQIVVSEFDIDQFLNLVQNMKMQTVQLFLDILDKSELKKVEHNFLFFSSLFRNLGLNEVYLKNINLLRRTIKIINEFKYNSNFMSQFLQNVADNITIIIDSSQINFEIIDLLLKIDKRNNFLYNVTRENLKRLQKSS